MKNIKELRRINRHKRILKKVSGSAEKPRLLVHRSLKNLYAQIIDDNQGKVLMGLSTRAKDVQSKIKFGGNAEAAAVLGETFAKVAVTKGIKKVSFDRGGYLYHGRVKSFADAVRKGGVEF